MDCAEKDSIFEVFDVGTTCGGGQENGETELGCTVIPARGYWIEVVGFNLGLRCRGRDARASC